MPIVEPAYWSDRLRNVLERYDETLLRQVVQKLLKPRSQWPASELIDRCLSTVSNVALIDRRLQSLEQPERRLLALIGHSRQPRWRVGNLLELLVALGHHLQVQPILNLLEVGLLCPELPDHVRRLKSFEQWLGGDNQAMAVFAHPHVTARTLGEPLGLPSLSTQHSGLSTVLEADGLEWPLRLAVLWQQVSRDPLRRTQQGDFFKRDAERLRGDPLLTGPAAEGLADAPDPGYLCVEWGLLEGLLEEKNGEITAGHFPPCWEQGGLTTAASLWAALCQLDKWNILDGGSPSQTPGNPYPSAYLLALLLLAQLPEEDWADPEALSKWIVAHHPYWTVAHASGSDETILSNFPLSLAYQLRLVQGVKDSHGQWLVRLSPLGRHMLGLESKEPSLPAYQQTLMVQPNLEIIAYRQGLTPGLISRLARFAVWKNLGAACTLQLEADAVYRALESELTFETILRTLEQHGMRPTPASVIESLRTWADKRERLGVYSGATLFEFNSPEDLHEALARGLPAVRLSDRLAAVADEAGIDFRHFKLNGARDYGLPPEKCVEVEDDGVTLMVDWTKSDLLLETELKRFAERHEVYENGRRSFKLTPASLAAGSRHGLSVTALEDWFIQRTGKPLTPAARLLLTPAETAPLEVRRQLVLHVSDAEVADGLMQWPHTRILIQSRLGPTALAVTDENVEELRRRLQQVGIVLNPAP